MASSFFFETYVHFLIKGMYIIYLLDSPCSKLLVYLPSYFYKAAFCNVDYIYFNGPGGIKD